MSFPLLLLLPVFCLTSTEPLNCPSTDIPTRLAAVSVWLRQTNSSSIYRLSDEDLTEEGYKRSTADRDNMVVMFARDSGQCSIGTCAVRLNTNRRNSDGAISLVENINTVPVEYTDINDTYICARHLGDCGADLPFFRFTRGSGDNISYAYSLDPAATFPNYTRDPKILCYGWADGGSVVHPLSTEYHCVRLQTIANAKITYSSTGSNFFPVGTTATLSCDDGYKGGGQSTVLCTHSGWYPSNGLGFCVEQNVNIALGHEMCPKPPNVPNGGIVYSQISREGRLPAQTKATIVCNLGYIIYGDAEIRCIQGKWSKMARCLDMSSVKCPPLLSPLGGKLSYSPSSAPYSLDANVSLSCDPGFVVSGLSSLTCGTEGWRGQIGICKSPGRSKRQATIGTPCPLLNVMFGKITFTQANSSVMYSSGTSALLTCDSGYTAQGSSSSFCLNGIWSPPIGTCTSSLGGVTSGGMLIPCFDVIQPLNGIVTYSDFGTHTSGSTVSLQCNLGYSASGAQKSTCSSGIWTPPLGTCTQGFGTSSTLECPNPVISNGFITYSQSSASESTKPVGTTATLTCNFGFSSSGSTTSTCFSGTWSPVLSSCIYNSSGSMNQQCSAIFAPLGATVMYSTGSSFGPFNSGTTVTITCPTGTSVPVSTCSNGQWQPPTPTSCSSIPVGGIGQSCSSMTAPFGVILTYSSGVFGPYNSGTVVTASCSSGEIIQGASTATCTNGQWSPMTLGTCGAQTGSGITCSSIIESPGSRIDYSDNLVGFTHQSGTTATLVCTVGMPMGVSRSTCMNGQWSPPIGSCSGTSTNGSGLQCVFGTTVSFGGTVTYSNGNSFGPWPDGSTATLNCPVGQYPQGSSVAYCTNGIWSNLGTCGTSTGSAGGSSGNSCSLLPPPTNGQVTFSQGGVFGPFPTGTTATVSCNLGFTISGASTAQCQNGIWTPSSLGTCISGFNGGSGSQCMAGLPSTTNGIVTYTNNQPFAPWPAGTTASLTCNTGYLPSGSSSSVCQYGHWVPPTLGQCIFSQFGGMVTRQCQAVPFVSRGTVSYSQLSLPPYAEGTTASLLCNLGTTPLGQQTVTCQGGTWVPFPGLGICQGALARAPTTLNDYKNSNSSVHPNTFCPPPKAPPFGEVTFSLTSDEMGFKEGTTAALRCKLGYSITGASFSTCRNGSFRPLLGKCSDGNISPVPGACTPISPPLNGRITYIQSNQTSNFEKGTTALLYCEHSFSVTGQATLTCSDDGWVPNNGFGQCIKSTK